ncbi:S1 family serine peptidase [Glycomyces terrestris]|nr:serine protease [Glycomyces terrestris]
MKRKHLVRLGAGVAAGLGAAAIAWAGTAANADPVEPEPEFEAQIIGGQPAEEGQYPWLVGLGSAGEGTPWERQFCGGSLIAEDVVLTAAHCVEDVTDPEELVVFSGSVDLDSPDLAETSVAAVHIAEDYNDPIAMANDWALLKLDERLPLEEVPLNVDTFEFDTLETAGWGNTGEEFPTVAQWVEVPFVSDADCQAAYPDEVDAASMLCAGDLENGGVDSCQGDSGGPIMAVSEDGDLMLVGIVSWGYGCAEAGNPGVYTEVAPNVDAIAEVVDGWL